MTLLSPLALLFGLLAAVPLILHLHQNRKRTLMLFSTHRFFTEAIVRTQRRLKLRRWLLLVLRMAACILLALALSRPILAWSGLVAGKGNRDLVIILDDSLSMSSTQNQFHAERNADPDPSTFQQARHIALAALDRLVTGDRAAIITTTGRIIAADDSGHSLNADLLAVRDRLNALKPTQAAGDMPTALRRTAALFNQNLTGGGRAHAVLILTDGQATDWRSGQWPALPLGCTTQIVTLAPPPTANVTADRLTLATPGSSAVIGQPNAVTVRLVNHAAQRRTTRLRLLVNQQPQADMPLELSGQSAVEHTFPVTFTQSGQQRIQLELLGLHDALPADDTLYAIVNVQSQLPILIVHGPEQSNRRSGAFYLQAALEAVGGSKADVKVQSITADQLTADALNRYRVVFLCDVPRLSPLATTALRRFVRRGGGLAVFPGPHIDTAWYNAKLADLLPATIGPPLSIPDHPLPIVQADITHPLLSRFSDNLRAAISDITVTQARDLQPHDAWIIAQLDGDHPFILQRLFHHAPASSPPLATPRQSEPLETPAPQTAPQTGGNVILIASQTQPQATNLPLRRLFIPFVHRLAAYLASSHASPPLAYTVGSPLVLPPNRIKFDVDHPPAAQTPDGSSLPTHVIAHAAAPRLAFTPPQPGFYTLGPAMLAVNTPRSESAPAPITSLIVAQAADWHVTLTGLLTPTGKYPASPTASASATFAPNLDALLAASRGGRGYWHTLLWIVLIVILIEPLIANYARPVTKGAA